MFTLQAWQMFIGKFQFVITMRAWMKCIQATKGQNYRQTSEMFDEMLGTRQDAMLMEWKVL